MGKWSSLSLSLKNAELRILLSLYYLDSGLITNQTKKSKVAEIGRVYMVEID